MAHEMTQELLKSLLHYDPETGVFTRLKVFHPRHKVGDAVASKGCGGLQYLYEDVRYPLRTLAWLYMAGSMPPRGVSCFNGDPMDTRWSNLRLNKAVPKSERHNRLTKADFSDPAKALELLSKVYSYNPETGEISAVRIDKVRRRVQNGEVVGSKNQDGYMRITAYYCEFLVHRVAHLFMTGRWPESTIDHINGQRDDNRWENLRDVDATTNSQNRRRPMPQNISGLLGAHVNSNKRAKKRFKSSIRVGGTRIRLGEFHTKEQAHEAYVNAKRRLHAGCTI